MQHKPIPQADGSLACTGTGCGGNYYSPLAFESHVSGRTPITCVANVIVCGPDDKSWEPASYKETNQCVNRKIEQCERERLTAAYYAELRRSEPHIAEGTGGSAFFD